MDATYDVVVIGGGAAGLSGALALARARRSVLVLDAGSPRNAPAGHVHNYLGREGTPPAELLAAGRAEVESYGGQVLSAQVVSLERLDDGRFRVHSEDRASVVARRLLVTTGLVDEVPDVPGLAERWGRDVLHCPYCHGWEVRDQPLGVLGTGAMSLHQALLFRQWSDDVTLFQHRLAEIPADSREQLDARGIRVVEGEVTGLEVVDDRLQGVRLQSGGVVRRSALVVAPAFVARSAVLTSLGLDAVEVERGGQVVGRAVPVDPTGASAVPGVWLAGNVTDVTAQVIVAAAAGLTAAAALNADLVTEDTRLAVEARRAAA